MLKCLALATTALAVAGCASRVSADGAQIVAAANTPGYSSVAAPPPVPGDRPPIDPATTAEAAPAPVFTAPATDITECDPGRLPTVEPGYLTVSVVGETSTGSPPLAVALASLEAEVVVDMANVLGYSPDLVRWTKPPERSDVEVGRLIAPMTADGHTWSAGYLANNDTLTVRADQPSSGSPEAIASQADRVGFIADSTGASVAAALGDATSVAYPDAQAGLQALAAGNVDLMIAPMASVAALGGPAVEVIGQVSPQGRYQSEQLRLRLPSESRLTGCLNSALDRLRIEGSLEESAARWLNVPVVDLT